MKKIIILTAIIIAALTMGFNSKGKDAERESNNQNLDKMLVKVVSSSLEQEGYYSCGITLSSVTELNEVKEYTVKIHHHRISELDDEEKTELLARLENISYPYSECIVNYAFVE